MSLKKRALKSIALALVGVTIAIPVANSVSAMEINSVSAQNIEFTNAETDIFNQGLVESIDIEGVTYTYEYYYDINGLKSISITNMARSQTQILTFDEKTSNIYLDGQKISEVNPSYDNVNSSTRAVDTSWKLTAGPVHRYISWAKGTTTAIVLGLISGALGLAGSYVSSALGGALSILAGQCSGGTLHYSKYYRNLALGQVQYRTDWSFVASTGDRYGTYTYLSTPQ